MAWKFKGKIYRNLEEQVRENQKNSLKNAKDINELAKKDEIKRVLDFEMSDNIFVGDDKTLPAYGAATPTEYFQKVGYLIAQLDMGDNRFMFAIARNVTDDGFIYFNMNAPSDDPEALVYSICYQIYVNTETDTVEFTFDDFYEYSPYGIDFSMLRDMMYPVSISYQNVSEYGSVELPYHGDVMQNHPNVWIRIESYNDSYEPLFRYLKQVYYSVEEGHVSIGFSNKVEAESGIFIVLSGQLDSNIFDVSYFTEV